MDYNSLVTKGEKCLKQGDYKNAISCFTSAIGLNPDTKTYLTVAKIFHDIKDYKRALNFLKQAWSLQQKRNVSTDGIYVIMHMVKCEELLGNKKDAMDWCNKGISIVKGNLIKKGGNVELENILTELQTLQRSLSKSSHTLDPISMIKQLERSGQYEEVLERLNKVIENETTDELLALRVTCLINMKRYDEAINDIDAAIEIHMKTLSHKDRFAIDLMINKGLSLKAIGQFSKAAEVLEDAVKSARFIDNIELIKSATNHLQEISAAINQRTNKDERIEVTRSNTQREESKKHISKGFNVASKGDIKSEELITQLKEEVKHIRYINNYENFGYIKEWYIVNITWFKKWLSYIKSIEERYHVEIIPRSDVSITKLASSEEPPTYINNEDLITKDEIILESLETPQDRPIDPKLRESKDFVIVPSNLWNIWKRQYKAYEILRFIHNINNTFYIDIYLRKIVILFRPILTNCIPKEHKVMYATKYETACEYKIKCENVLAQLTKRIPLKLRLWKLEEHIMNQLEKSYDIKHIEGSLIEEEERIVEKKEKCICTFILVELAHANKPFTFTKKGANILVDVKKSNMGVTGLENTMNNCYVNAGVQCLSNCKELTKYFLSEDYKKDLNKDNPAGSKGELAITYAKLLDNLWNESSKSTTAEKLKKQLGLKANQFKDNTQQDSEEFVLYLLNNLHEDLNRSKVKSPINIKDNIQVDQWTKYLEHNNSIITDLFLGQMKTHLACPQCKYSIDKFECFLIINTPIPSIRYLDLVYVPKKITEQILRFRVMVTGMVSVKDLKEKVKTQGQLIYATVSNERIQSFISNSTLLTDIDMNEIYAFEYEDNNIVDGCFVEIKITWRVFDQTTKIPILHYTSTTITLKELKAELDKILFSFSPNMYNLYELKLITTERTYDYPLDNTMTIEQITKKIGPFFINIILLNDSRLITHLNSIDNVLIDASEFKISVYDYLNEFTRKEKLDKGNKWICNNCRTSVQGIKNISLCKLPIILIIHLKRFKIDGAFSEKRDDFIDYPVNGLDLSKYCLGTEGKVKYDLFGVIRHFGEIGQGHYTAICKNSAKNYWLEYDDERVYRIEEKDIVTNSGYVLFYRRADSHTC